MCNSYVSELSICDLQCQATTQPTVSGTLGSDGTFGVSVYDPVTMNTTVTVSTPSLFCTLCNFDFCFVCEVKCDNIDLNT